MKILKRSFYERDPTTVARELLGKVLVHRLDSEVLSGKIVETEAYFGQKDPASRAHMGRKPYDQLMFMEAGRTFIYMVHANWLLNITAHRKNGVGGVLIRAVEPLQGIEVMKKNRSVNDMRDLTNGPGKLTRALAITKELNGIDVTKENNRLVVTEGREDESFESCSSHRIGVKADLHKELRFFIKGNIFVSRSS